MTKGKHNKAIYGSAETTTDLWTTTESMSQSAQMEFELTSETLDRDFVETDTGFGLRKSTFLIDLSDWTKSTYTSFKRLANRFDKSEEPISEYTVSSLGLGLSSNKTQMYLSK